MPPPAPPSGICIDKSFDCASRALQCTVAEYRQLLVDECPVTCGICTPTFITTTPPLPSAFDTTLMWYNRIDFPAPIPYQQPASCIDRRADCADLQHLCTIVAYNHLMHASCPATCAFCKHDSVDQQLSAQSTSMMHSIGHGKCAFAH
jgi:hypothetical protein